MKKEAQTKEKSGERAQKEAKFRSMKEALRMYNAPWWPNKKNDGKEQSTTEMVSHQTNKQTRKRDNTFKKIGWERRDCGVQERHSYCGGHNMAPSGWSRDSYESQSQPPPDRYNDTVRRRREEKKNNVVVCVGGERPRLLRSSRRLRVSHTGDTSRCSFWEKRKRELLG